MNPKASFRGAVLTQSLLASVLHAAVPRISAALVSHTSLGVSSSMVFLWAWAVVSCVLVYLYASPGRVEACESLRSHHGDGDGDKDGGNNTSTCRALLAYLRQAAVLLTSSEHRYDCVVFHGDGDGDGDGNVSFVYRVYQAHICVLAAATASMYNIASYSILLWTQCTTASPSPSVCLSTNTASNYLMLAFTMSFLSRLLSLLCVRHISSRLFITIGSILLAIGSAAFYLSHHFVSVDSVWQLLLPSLCVLSGVGLSMPHCKAEAIVEMPSHLLSSATSVLKISQLCGALFSSLIIGAFFEASVLPIATVLSVFNGFALFFLLYVRITS